MKKFKIWKINTRLRQDWSELSSDWGNRAEDESLRAAGNVRFAKYPLLTCKITSSISRAFIFVDYW